jgi:Fe-S-cluster containining protein
MDDPSVCARCAGQGPTCCQTSSDADDLCFPVSAGEAVWLRPYATDGAATCSAVTSVIFQQRLKSLFPSERRRISSVFPLGGKHRRLVLTSEGKCVFLAPTGCRIPRGARPLYCRIFPFWVVDERLTFLSHDGCLAQGRQPVLGDLLHRLHTSAEEILSIYLRLRHYWHIDSET